jgi:hypothetical protein
MLTDAVTDHLLDDLARQRRIDVLTGKLELLAELRRERGRLNKHDFPSLSLLLRKADEVGAELHRLRGG